MHQAMDMFSDLRQFAEAKAWAEEWDRTRASEQASLRSGAVQSEPNQTGPMSQALVQRQAEWNEELKDFQAAANMYLQVLPPPAPPPLSPNLNPLYPLPPKPNPPVSGFGTGRKKLAFNHERLSDHAGWLNFSLLSHLSAG